MNLGLHQFICPKCAKANGATWPKDHFATFHNGRCASCEKQASVCAVNDWDWKQNKKLERDREL